MIRESMSHLSRKGSSTPASCTIQRKQNDSYNRGIENGTKCFTHCFNTRKYGERVSAKPAGTVIVVTIRSNKESPEDYNQDRAVMQGEVGLQGQGLS